MARPMNKEIDLTTVQGRIKSVYLDTKLTQEAFADIIKIGQSHLSGIMSTRMPSRRILQIIANYTGANLLWLETGQGNQYAKAEPLDDHPELDRVIKESVKIWGLSLEEFPLSERYEMAYQLLKIIESKKRTTQHPAFVSPPPAPKKVSPRNVSKQKAMEPIPIKQETAPGQAAKKPITKQQATERTVANTDKMDKKKAKTTPAKKKAAQKRK